MTEYIGRKALIKSFSELTDPLDTACVFQAINELPAADVRPVVYSKWVPADGSYEKYYCLVCGGTDTNCSDYYSSHNVLDQEYCPWCGAKMIGGV